MNSRNGLFLGLTTIDIIYLVNNPPEVDQKINARDQFVAAGGPVTNAAIAFSVLGGKSTLVAALGNHPLNNIVFNEFKKYDIKNIDLAPDYSGLLSLSSIMIKESTGERSIVSLNAIKLKINKFPKKLNLNDINLILVDGHQMKLSIELCEELKKSEVVTVIDAGSWKAGTEKLLNYIDYAICSEKFIPPDCKTQEDVVKYISNFGIKYIAITRGDKPIFIKQNNIQETIKVDNRNVKDTVGAGDILHGAFCYYILEKCLDFRGAVDAASKIATCSCRYFGTREWIKKLKK